MRTLVGAAEPPEHCPTVVSLSAGNTAITWTPGPAQTYTSSGAWTKPADSTTIIIRLEAA